MIKKRSLLPLIAVLFLLLLSTLTWQYYALTEIELSVPIRIDYLPGNLVVTGQPLKEVEVQVRGQKTLLDLFQTQEHVCVLDLREAKAGLVTLPVGEANLQFPEKISVAHIEPTSITLRLEPKLTKMVPVVVTLSDNPAPGYRTDLTVATPGTLQISGPEKVIAPIEQIATLPISVKDMAESFKKEVTVVLPSEVTIGYGGTSLVTAQVSIKENIITRRFENIPVAGRNTVLPAKITPPQMTVDVKGPENILTGLSPDTDIKAYVDLKDLAPGIYVRRSQITLPVGTTLAGADPEVFKVVIGQ